MNIRTIVIEGIEKDVKISRTERGAEVTASDTAYEAMVDATHHAHRMVQKLNMAAMCYSPGEDVRRDLDDLVEKAEAIWHRIRDRKDELPE